jgi:inhibitor of cysteine peptidase
MKSLIGYSMLALSALAHANDPLSVNVNKKESSFVINLPANPTTGYQWSVATFDKDLLTLSSGMYQKPDTQLIGAGGHMLYTFTLNAGKIYPKNTKIVFKYARPWEKKDAGSIQKVIVNFIDSKN